MERLPFFTVDVFAEGKYTGNQLAVFSDAGTLSDQEMQQIAREVNYSETTFILSREPRVGGYDVRIFTPQKEVPFAGHPTLGTAYVIQQEMIRGPVETVTLNLEVGQIPVTFHYSGREVDRVWMRQIEPAFGQVLSGRSVSGVLGLAESELDDRFPVEEVSTGLPSVIVPLKGLDSLRRIRVARDRYFDLIENGWAKLVLVFCRETRGEQNHLSVRVFADYYGVPEDPATGSANGCLAGYLVKHRYFGEPAINVRVEQGHDVGRPSLLFLKAEEQHGGIAISVGGRVVKVAEGEFV